MYWHSMLVFPALPPRVEGGSDGFRPTSLSFFDESADRHNRQRCQDRLPAATIDIIRVTFFKGWCWW